MRDGSTIEGDRNSCGRRGLGDYGNEIEDGGLNVEIGGLFNDKS